MVAKLRLDALDAAIQHFASRDRRPPRVLCAASAPAAAQGPYTLSGTVYGGGSPLQNTLVEALEDGTATVVAANTTSTGGQYSLSLADGTYDLRVTPPSGSGFGQETVQNISIAGADRHYDVILLATSGALQGVVRGYAGQPVADAYVYVYTANWQFIASTRTDTSGAYSIGLSPGTVNIIASGGFPASPYQNLGLYQRATPLVEGALSARRRTLGSSHRDVAVAMSDLGELMRLKGEYKAAEQTLREARALEERQAP